MATSEPFLKRLPHGDEARMVSRILEIHDDRIACEAVIAQDSPWVAGGRCPAFVAIEAAAQTAALLGGREETHGGSVVRARRIVCARSELVAGAPLRVTARRAGSAPPLFVFDVEVEDADGRILEGQIGIHLDL